MLPWMIECGLITAAALSPKLWTSVGLPAPKGTYPKVGVFPAPSNYLASAIIFGPIALLSDTKVGPAASLVGWGVVLATLLTLIDPADPLNPSTPTAPAAKPAAAPASKG